MPRYSQPVIESDATPRSITYKKVQKYKPEEINLDDLAAKAQKILNTKPFQWQLEIAQAILCGQDVVVDVGTGSGKTLVFTLPLLQDENDIIVTVSPLTALMTDQASTAAIPTVAVCAETIAKVGAKQLYKDIVAGRFRQVIVSPEIALSDSLRKGVLSKEEFNMKLRGRFPRNVPFVVASATLPDHVLDDIKRQLRLDESVRVVSVSNARPNVALSIREMQHSEESKADLRFLIPQNATNPVDIPITLVYGNTRTMVEDGADHLRDWAQDCEISRDCIAFYHAKVGEHRKRELERQLREGIIRILGCDMRNISRVILWGMPPSFCALVQRAGRAGRDLSTNAESILRYFFHSRNSPAQEVMGPEDTLDISSTKVTVLKLSADGSNWTTYHECILNAFTSKKLRRHVTGTARRPAELIERNGKFYLTADEDAKPLSDTEIETQEELIETWLQKEAQVREIIYGTVDQSTFLQIKGEPTVAAVWKKLTSIHADK
ncbi:hypothetical protein H0H92_007260, partial [Tricholoma furcatifolium]